MNKISRNMNRMQRLFGGRDPGHFIVYNPPGVSREGLGDYAISDRPVSDWVGYYTRDYENKVAALEHMDDDAVPYVNLCGYTGIFASAFGCPIHEYEGMNTNPVARAIVDSPEAADSLPEVKLKDSRELNRFLELAELMSRELGPDVPISVPDIQSPFGIAAIIWEKESMFLSMMTEPDAVKRLVNKTSALLEEFILTFREAIAQANLCHCPYAWAPPEMGCWLSEDEVGAFSLDMFREFCLPSLSDLSRTTGGMFIHCCAHARHQYDGFLEVPSLRGLNPSFRRIPPADCVRMFAGQAVIMVGYIPEEQMNEMLDLQSHENRFLFGLDGMSYDEAKPLYDRLRERCPRRD
jgi:hypothetical protein